MPGISTCVGSNVQALPLLLNLSMLGPALGAASLAAHKNAGTSIAFLLSPLFSVRRAQILVLWNKMLLSATHRTSNFFYCEDTPVRVCGLYLIPHFALLPQMLVVWVVAYPPNASGPLQCKSFLSDGRSGGG